jgi:hypothetical protein
VAEARLDVAHDVVAEVAGEPAREAQRRAEGRRLERAQVRVDPRERILDFALLGRSRAGMPTME